MGPGVYFFFEKKNGGPVGGVFTNPPYIKYMGGGKSIYIRQCSARILPTEKLYNINKTDYLLNINNTFVPRGGPYGAAPLPYLYKNK